MESETRHDKSSVLIVDDERSNRIILRAYLEREGFQVFEAEDGEQALEQFVSNRPSMVLMDIMMPNLDGYQATRKIKEAAGNEFIPVIFLTAASDEESLAKCIACGGDDFLTKPYSRVIINAKIQALERLRAATHALQTQKQELEFHNQRLQQEHEFSERIFSKIVQSRQFMSEGTRIHIAPMGIASGDLVLAAKHPIDGRYIMIGDFTGHGLSAALGAIPVSDVFYSMASKGLPLSMMVAEINRKLCEKLPTGFFMAACFIFIKDTDGAAEIWTGGVPDVVVVGKDGKVKQKIHSRHLALGVDRAAVKIGMVENVVLEYGECIFAYSDGLLDLRNPKGEMFGENSLMKILDRGTDPETLYDDLFATITAFRGTSALSDDLSLIEVRRIDNSQKQELSKILAVTETQKQREVEGKIWRFQVDAFAGGLRELDLTQLSALFLERIPELGTHQSSLLTVIAELLGNAIDHGILELDSSGKYNEKGFMKFYEQRERLLRDLAGGSVILELEFSRLESHREIRLRVKDSGVGFNNKGGGRLNPDGSEFKGRGMMLVKSLCKEVRYNDVGNEVEAVFVW